MGLLLLISIRILIVPGFAFSSRSSGEGGRYLYYHANIAGLILIDFLALINDYHLPSNTAGLVFNIKWRTILKKIIWP